MLPTHRARNVAPSDSTSSRQLRKLHHPKRILKLDRTQLRARQRRSHEFILAAIIKLAPKPQRSHDLFRPLAGSNPAAFGEIYSRIEYHLVAPLDAAVDFDLASEVAHHRNFAQVHHAILHDGDLQA